MAKGASTPGCHVLDFFCDEASSCALTVLVRGFRFHIIADKDELSKSTGTSKRYEELVQKLRSNGDDGAASPASRDDQTETDSGIDVNDSEETKPKEQDDPEEALQQFMLQPLSTEFQKLPNTEEEETLQDWYNGPTYFYNLEVTAESKLDAVQLEAAPDLAKRMEKLKPQMVLPKQLTDRLDVPYHQASDLTVIGTSDQPPGTPYHPCRVRHNDSQQVHFLKIVDNNQPQPVKRELDILYRAMELKLNKEINVPSLEGLVMFDGAEGTKTGQKRVMGFLQTDIPDAKPLTGLLDPAIDQAKRERWAKDADHAKEVLHEHDIIWGDAKADNFVVDKDDKLWIIDFGGSYTAGWVDPELNETVEGDDMGTERIVNALEDPVANTYDPDKDEAAPGGEHGKEKPSVTFSPDKELKRRREVSEDEGSADDRNKKARKQR